MTDSELHEIENHISWGWHDDKGNDDVRLLFNEIMRLRAVAAEAREEGREEGIAEMVEAVFLELGGDVDKEFLEGIAAERLKEKA